MRLFVKFDVVKISESQIFNEWAQKNVLKVNIWYTSIEFGINNFCGLIRIKFKWEFRGNCKLASHVEAFDNEFNKDERFIF